MRTTNMRRLENLEERRAERVGGTACPACGHVPGAPVVFTFDPTPAPVRRPEATMLDEYCGTCGAPTRFTIRIDHREEDAQ